MKRAQRPNRTRSDEGAAYEPTWRPRIFRELEVNGARYWTLFDSSARGTYVTRAVAARLPRGRLAKPVRRGLGGRSYLIREDCLLGAVVEGYEVRTHAFVVERLFGDDTGRPIGIILGAECLETWGIGLDMKNKRLDFTHYQKEAVEG